MSDFGPDGTATGSTIQKITPEGEVEFFATGMRDATGGAFNSNGI